MILCIGATPAVQRVMVFQRVTLDRVNRAVQTLETIAGKSVNVAKVLKSLGEDPFALGFAGGERGAFIRSELARREIPFDFIEVPPQTRLCTTVIDQGNGTITELVEESGEVPDSLYELLLADLRSRAPAAQALVMSGTITPGGPGSFYKECCHVAHDAGALAVVDAQGPLLIEALQASPDLVKPNRAELGKTVGRELRDESSVLAAMQELCRLGARQVVVTAGPEPVLGCEPGRAWRVSAYRLEAANPIGSGDAFTAGLVAVLAEGRDLGEALHWGMAAGAANAASLLPGEVKLQDVNSLMTKIEVQRL